jgi:hypothetical protein
VPAEVEEDVREVVLGGGGDYGFEVGFFASSSFHVICSDVLVWLLALGLFMLLLWLLLRLSVLLYWSWAFEKSARSVRYLSRRMYVFHAWKTGDWALADQCSGSEPCTYKH